MKVEKPQKQLKKKLRKIFKQPLRNFSKVPNFGKVDATWEPLLCTTLNLKLWNKKGTRDCFCVFYRTDTLHNHAVYPNFCIPPLQTRLLDKPIIVKIDVKPNNISAHCTAHIWPIFVNILLMKNSNYFIKRKIVVARTLCWAVRFSFNIC